MYTPNEALRSRPWHWGASIRLLHDGEVSIPEWLAGDHGVFRSAAAVEARFLDLLVHFAGEFFAEGVEEAGYFASAAGVEGLFRLDCFGSVDCSGY